MAILHNSPCLLNSFLDQFPQLVMSRGADLAKLSQLAGLSVVEITGPTQLIAFDRFIDLLEISAAELKIDDLALQLASRQDLRALGPVSIMIGRCKDSDEAMLTVFKYLRLIVSGVTMEAKLDEDSIIIEIDTHLPALQVRPQFQDYLVASTVMVLRCLHGAWFPIQRCQLYQQEPGYSKRRALSDYLGCQPQFGRRPTRLVVNQDFLSKPLNVRSLQTPNISSDIQAARVNLEQSVTDALLYIMLTGKPSIEQIAPLLGYSPRTLRRRLAELGLSFSDILDATRITQANKYLQSTHYRLADIASLLGFTNQSAFTRSYLRCSGITPSQYRKSLIIHES